MAVETYTPVQYNQRRQMIDMILDFLRARDCCNRNVLEGGLDFHAQNMDELKNTFRAYFPKVQVPGDQT